MRPDPDDSSPASHRSMLHRTLKMTEGDVGIAKGVGVRVPPFRAASLV